MRVNAKVMEMIKEIINFNKLPKLFVLILLIQFNLKIQKMQEFLKRLNYNLNFCIKIMCFKIQNHRLLKHQKNQNYLNNQNNQPIPKLVQNKVELNNN